MPQQKLSAAQWQAQQPVVQDLFLQRKKYKEIVQVMHDRGFPVSQTQLERQMKKWGYRRNLSCPAWTYIRHRVQKRIYEKKKSLVLVDGEKIDDTKLQKEMRRYDRVSMIAQHQMPPSPPPPKNYDIVIRSPSPHSVCSPASQQPTWWERLPWFQFLKCNPNTSILSLFFSSRTAESLPLLSFTTQGSSTQLAVGWGRFTAHFAIQLTGLIPESYMGLEFVRTDLILSKSPKKGISELLKLFMFRFSNNLHDDEDDKSDCSSWNMFKMFFNLFGLENMPLLNLSSDQSPTLLSSMEAIFQKCLWDITIDRGVRDNAERAVITRNAIQIMEWVLKCGYDANKALSKNGIYWSGVRTSFTPLQLAAMYGKLELVRLLLEYKANPEAYTDKIWLSPIQLGLGDREQTWIGQFRHAATSDIIVHLLLESGVGTDPSHWNYILEAAIRHGREDIIHRFHEQNRCNFGFRLSKGRNELITEFTALTAAAHVSKATCAEWPYNALEWFLHIVQFIPRTEYNSLLFGKPDSSVDLLISAARVGNDDIVQHLLDCGADINRANIFGITTLHAAIAGSHLETCKLLLRRGYQLSDNRGEQASILHLAFIMSDIDVLMWLINAGLDPNAQIDEKGIGILRRCTTLLSDVRWNPGGLERIPFNERTALVAYIACHIIGSKRDYEPKKEWQPCAICLLGAGVEIHGGEVISGVVLGHHEWVEKALHAGGNPNETLPYGGRCYNCSDKSRSCLAVALKKGDWAIARTLLAGGAKLGHDEMVSALRGGDADVIREVVQPAVLEWNASFDGESLLEAAMHPDNPSSEVLEWAFTHCSEAYDAGSLCAAVQLAIRSGDANTVKRILARRPDCREPNILEGTAVAIAADGGDRDLLQLLLNRLPPSTKSYIPWAQLHERNCFQSRSFWRGQRWRPCGSSPLVAANNAEIVSLMLASGYRADRLSLCRAVAREDAASAEIMLKNQPLLPSCQVHDTRKPVVIAANSGDVDMIGLLLRHGQNINEWGPLLLGEEFNFTPLQAAARNGDLKTVDFLLQHGSDVNAPPCFGPYGGTALQVAAPGGHLAVAKRLLDHSVPARVNAHRSPHPNGRTALEGAAENGRLDMVQLLLDHGAKTTGRHQRQYLRAIALAEEMGFDAIASLLRKVRQLDQDDSRKLRNVQDYLNVQDYPSFRDYDCRCSDCVARSECSSECSESECIRAQRETYDPSNNEGFCTPPPSDGKYYYSDLDDHELPAPAITAADTSVDSNSSHNTQDIHVNDWEELIAWSSDFSDQGDKGPGLLSNSTLVEQGGDLRGDAETDDSQLEGLFDFIDGHEESSSVNLVRWFDGLSSSAAAIEEIG